MIKGLILFLIVALNGSYVFADSIKYQVFFSQFGFNNEDFEKAIELNEICKFDINEKLFNRISVLSTGAPGYQKFEEVVYVKIKRNNKDYFILFDNPYVYLKSSYMIRSVEGAVDLYSYFLGLSDAIGCER